MSYKQEPVDTIDYDRFVDFDQAVLSPGSSASKGKAIETPDLLTPTSSRNFLAQQQLNTQSMFSGPSHQYDQHTQQTGLPTGALANALAANKNTAFHLGGYTNTYNTSNGVNFDFNAPLPQTYESTDMDLDFNTPIDGFYDGPSTGFVDPTFIGGQEEVSPVPQRSEIVRMWPGMHKRQAELAKQQQQQEIQRQQQTKSGAQQQPQQQSQQSTQGHKRTGSKANASANRPADPIVEERISRLLNQMRHSSVTSSNEDNNNSQNTQSQLSKTKKDEEDMDEDERLLASEEGKKLSSKERRQLRNKVSARAFRSRRKEYIGQLEGELALKGQENDDLRAENEALKAENNRLTDLSKMLLSSSAFSTFLNDLSANGMPAPAALASQAQQSFQAQQSQQQLPKDVNSNQHQPSMHQQSSMQIGMTMIPEQNMDFLAPSNGNWTGGMDYRVFSVTELPEPVPQPIDTGILSGKTNNFVPSFADSKDDAPVIESLPKSDLPVQASESEVQETDSQIVDETVEFDESDPAFALFVNAQPSTTSPTTSVVDIATSETALEKNEQTTDDDMNLTDLATFDSLCSTLDATLSRISNMTANQ